MNRGGCCENRGHYRALKVPSPPENEAAAKTEIAVRETEELVSKSEEAFSQ